VQSLTAAVQQQTAAQAQQAAAQAQQAAALAQQARQAAGQEQQVQAQHAAAASGQVQGPEVLPAAACRPAATQPVGCSSQQQVSLREERPQVASRLLCSRVRTVKEAYEVRCVLAGCSDG
jgi:hypothetical protein